MARGDVFRNYQSKPLVGQKGLPGIKPDITPIMALFLDAPAPEAGEVRAVKMFLGFLACRYKRYFGWSDALVAQVLREMADEPKWWQED